MRISTLTFAVSFALAGTFGGALSSSAQTIHRLSLEGRVGVTFPTGDLADAGYGSSVSLGADAMYNFTPVLTGYAGLSRDAFSCDTSEDCGDDASTFGLQAGLKALLRREGRVLPWVRGGLIGQKLDVGVDESDFGFGFEVGGGIDYDVSPRFALVPGLHYRSFSADFGDSDTTASWLALTLGGHIHF